MHIHARSQTHATRLIRRCVCAHRRINPIQRLFTESIRSKTPVQGKLDSFPGQMPRTQSGGGVGGAGNTWLDLAGLARVRRGAAGADAAECEFSRRVDGGRPFICACLWDLCAGIDAVAPETRSSRCCVVSQ
jgi:hypothetical protein